MDENLKVPAQRAHICQSTYIKSSEETNYGDKRLVVPVFGGMTGQVVTAGE